MLRDVQPWKSQETQHLLQEEFGVSYSPNYLGPFFGSLVYHTRNHAQSVHIDQRILMKLLEILESLERLVAGVVDVLEDMIIKC